MATTYDIGDRPTVTAAFTNAAGTATDPTTVITLVRTPAGIETSYTSPSNTTNPSVGTFAFTFPAAFDTAGTWVVRMKGTAGVIAAAEVALIVRQSEFTTP